MLNATEAAARYEPRATDTPKELFLARLQICEACQLRQGLSCLRSTMPSPVCTVLARSPQINCPERKWPGDAPRTLPTPKVDEGILRRAIARTGKLVRAALRRKQAASRVWVKPSSSLSIIIAGRNYARFLPDAIQSALNQIPCEVIYSDDASSDDSVDVARAYADRGLTVLQNPIHQGAAEARAKACAIARGDWIITLDADDVLPPRYAAAMLAHAAPDAPFVYADAQAWGEHNTYWKAAKPDTSLWIRNYVNTSAMYSRAAYHAAGGWQDGIGTMWDWDLALRARRFGTPRHQTQTPLYYRQHAASFSHVAREHDETVAVAAREKVRRRLARISVGSILSGRLPTLFPKWLDQLARSVRQLQSPHPVDLVLLDHSPDAAFAATLARETARHADTFETIRILPAGRQLEYSTEEDRRDEVSRFLATACNRLKAEMRGDLLWIVEDDIFVPLDAASKLFTAVTAAARPPVAVSGTYVNRHCPSKIVGGWWRASAAHEQHAEEIAVGCRQATRAEDLAKLQHGNPHGIPVDLAGAGCLMLWADRAPSWTSHHKGLGKNIPAHDWAWSAAVTQQGGQVLLLPSVPCAHAVDATNLLAW
ncbi:MAG: glycosyltransferase [Patescibacteria group bacterium]|nr:glycosyltransferase [Patescibacteria group bacterium]